MNKLKSLFFLIKLSLLFSFITCSDNYSFKKDIIKKDSISIWIKFSKKKDLKIQEKKKYLRKAYLKNNRLKEDSIKSINLSSIAYLYYKLDDSINFIKINNESYDLAVKVKSVYNLADTHWNFATFYKKKESYAKAYYHFNEAYNLFNEIGEENNAGIMLYGMSFIKGRYRNYIESEKLIIKAIEKFKIKQNYRRLYTSYNQLGELQRDIKEYDKALFYYDKALKYLGKIKNKKNNIISIYNNIAFTYLSKKEYNKALKYFNKDLNKDISVSKYARVLTNRAYCKLLIKDTFGIKKDFFIALKIRDSLHDKAGIVSSKIEISDYYTFLKDTINAKKYAKEANVLAKQIKNGGEYLKTLKQLANLDAKNSKKYLDRYIVFNDSLISEERKAQNKFTRIEFETDEYIEETEKLTQQNLLITISSIGTILVLSLLYFIRVQKVKNEKLRSEADQQKANEEVYVLTLQQQAKLEKERVKERNRISAELHDGILGKLFGTRVSLGFLGMKMETDTQEKHQTFLEELQVIEKEIRDVSHKLSDNFDDATINFSSIIAQLLKDKSSIGGFKHEFIHDKTIVWKSIDEVTKANVYRIIQESLQNIIKHAKAKKVILEFSILNDSICIDLQDNGVGFNTKKSKSGIGLKNIKSRIKKLNGTLTLTSAINKGTKLSIIIPYITNDS